jgi:hypothetical protein
MLRAMRLTVIFLVAACLQVSAEGFSQGISISEKNISLEKVFSEIKKQAGIHSLTWNPPLLKQKKYLLI